MNIKKEFKLSEAQYVSVLKDTMALVGSTPEKPKKPMGPLRQRLRSLIVMLIIFAAIVLWSDKHTLVLILLYSIIWGGFAAYLNYYIPYCYRAIAQKVYRTSASIQNDQVIEISPEGVTSTGNDHKSTLAWSQIYKIEKGNHNYLIFLNYCSAIGIPLDLLNEAEQAALVVYNSQLRPAIS